jgi:hypothetical protein
MKSGDVKLVGAFALTGLLVPLGLLVVLWLGTPDHSFLTLRSFAGIADVLCPSLRWVLASYQGAADWGLTTRLFVEAAIINGLVYGAVATFLAMGFRALTRLRKHIVSPN